MKKLALFDFCDTLVNFQTADAFVDYVRRKDDRAFMNFLNFTLKVLGKLRIISIINKFFPGSSTSKKMKLLQLKGFKYEELNKLAELFYQEMIKPNLIISVMNEMKRLAQQDYEICLVSAGYSLYLKYFAEDHQIKHLIATEIAFNQKDNYCIGKISGTDCIHVEKVNKIKDYYKGQNVSYIESISYSDSISDLPMLLLVGKAVVVSQTNSQPWAHQYKFNEIIWS